MSHTPTPWRVTPAEWEDDYEATDDCEGSEGYPVSGAEISGADGKSIFTLDLGEYSGLSTETARRIAACVNACAEVSTEILEDSDASITFPNLPYRKLKEQHDFAIDVIKHLVDEAKLTSDQYELCRQAISNAEGSA